MARWTTLAASVLREVFARETLPPPPAAPPAGPRRASGLLATLFAREELSDLPERAPPLDRGERRGALALLFAPEPLPEDPPPTPREGGRWLAWLFAPERLDD